MDEDERGVGYFLGVSAFYSILIMIILPKYLWVKAIPLAIVAAWFVKMEDNGENILPYAIPFLVVAVLVFWLL